jgi:hypothetical protein
VFEKHAAKKLQQSGGGVHTQAVILTATHGHSASGGSVHWKMTVRVQPPGEPEFEAKVEGNQAVGTSFLPGMTVGVRYDPANHSTINFDDSIEAAMSHFAGGPVSTGSPDVNSLLRDIMANPGSAAGRASELMAAFGAGGQSATVFVNGQQVNPGGFGPPTPSAFPYTPAATNTPAPSSLGALGVPPPPPSSSDPVQLLTQLAQLRAQGVIDDVEFATQKARILGGA